MVPRDVEKTAFKTPIDNFYYTVMPFGLKNASATYRRTMTAIFHNMMYRELEDYVDDRVVKSRRQEDHVKVLRKVFKIFRVFKLRMNPLKCAFGVSARKFLGFLVHIEKNRCGFGENHSYSNHEATYHSERIEEFSGESFLHPEVHPGLRVNHFNLCQIAQEGTKLQVGRGTADNL